MAHSDNKPGKLPYVQWTAAIFGSSASLAGLAFTLSRWGVTETLCGVGLILGILAAASLILLTLLVLAWEIRKRGLTGPLSDAVPVFLLAAAGSVILATLAVVAAVMMTYGPAQVTSNAADLCILGYVLGKGLQRWRTLRGTPRKPCPGNTPPSMTSPRSLGNGKPEPCVR